MKIRLFLFILFNGLVFNTQAGNDKKSTQDRALCQSIHEDWLTEALELTKQTPGYSAPVAARTFAYFSIGMYESCLELLTQNQSLNGQLNDWNRTTWKSNYETLSSPLVANEVNHILIRYFYVNMPPASSEKVKSLHIQWKLELQKKVKLATLVKSIDYAEKLAAEIIAWSRKDGADNCWNKNFPTDFQEKKCPGCWTKTQPGFESALQPFWGNNRTFLTSNTLQCQELQPLPFSTDPNSAFYLENLKLVDFYKTITTEQKNTAKYWDDAPGVSGTPVGHLFSIALQAARDHQLDLNKELELFVTLCIAINDAVIESWRLKYAFSAIRPITYIQQFIDPKFNTAIPTPPFPEFPSGHSFQSGTSSEIFNHFFNLREPITDRTNEKRTDIPGSARSFQNFTVMSEEMSQSRFYGGIHYDYTLKQSLIYGRKIGQNTLQNLHFLKN